MHCAAPDVKTVKAVVSGQWSLPVTGDDHMHGLVNVPIAGDDLKWPYKVIQGQLKHNRMKMMPFRQMVIIIK